MKRLLAFSRAMRSRGFRYHAGVFVLLRVIGGREAYSTVKVSARQVNEAAMPVDAIAEYWLARANHRLDAMATA